MHTLGYCFKKLLPTVVKYAPEKMRRMLYDIKTFVGVYPMLYLPLARLLYGSDTGAEHIVTRRSALRNDTEIVIEGFNRSANTFAVAAFKLAQPRPVRIAYRLHAPAQVIAAAKMNIPTLVLIRNPEDAILSFVIHQSHSIRTNVTMKQALKAYISFYESIILHRHHFVLATFDAVVADFGKIIRKVNNKFGTGFLEFIHTEDNVKECFKLIEEGYGKGEEIYKIVAKPSKERRKIKDALRSEFRAENLAELRERAYRIYYKMIKE